MDTFSSRLAELIGDQSISGFARKVDLSEALIRKYLNGSEPSLSRANQIVQNANCSLEWLATGEGYQYRKAEVVDMEALELAMELAERFIEQHNTPQMQQKRMKLIVAAYQHLRSTKKQDGYFEQKEAEAFINYIGNMCL